MKQYVYVILDSIMLNERESHQRLYTYEMTRTGKSIETELD